MDLLSPSHSDLREATRDARAAALFIDLALRALSFVVLAGIGVGLRSVPLVAFAPVSFGISVAAFALLDALLLTWRGETLGKLLPYFGFLWLFLDHLWALGPERRAVHDRLADTAVFVRRTEQRQPPTRAPA